jgi:glycosyltransferase involved in cell wall biosynthesis
MRILLVNHEYSMSGAALMLLDLAACLQAEGHQLCVAAMNPQDGPLRQEYETRGIPAVYPIEVTDFDLAIVNTLPCAPAVIALAARLRTIWWIHESEVGLELLGKAPEWLEAFELAHRIVFPSQRMRDHAYRSYHYKRREENVVVIPNGLHVDSPVAAVEEKARPWRIVCVGTVHAVKRQGDIVEALELLGRDDIELVMVGFKVVIVGAAEAHAAARPDRYRVLGQRPHAETLGWIASADLIVQPSQGESHALALGEAARFAKPLIVSDLPVFTEQGWRHGHNCLMQPVGNIAMLAANIDFMLGNDEERRRLAKASARMRQGYRHDVFRHRFLELIDGVRPRKQAAQLS